MKIKGERKVIRLQGWSEEREREWKWKWEGDGDGEGEEEGEGDGDDDDESKRNVVPLKIVPKSFFHLR